jgi:hypothetical protein
MRRSRRELRPCLEGCEPRLLLSNSTTVTVLLGDGTGGFNTQKS